MKKSENRYSLIGCASDVGGLYRGAAAAPSTLRSLELLQVFSRLSIDVEDLGDISSPSTLSANPSTEGSPQSPSSAVFSEAERSILNIDAVHSVCAEVARRCEHSVNLGRIPIVIGGDHSLSIGSVAGIVNARQSKGLSTGLVWVDAHADLNTPEESHSRCAFGMPVAAISGRFRGALSSLCHASPMMDERNIYWVGLRDVDPSEAQYLRSRGLREENCQTMAEIDNHGIGSVTTAVLQQLAERVDGFILSFDLDVCDPNLAPGTGTPKRGGLTFRESHLLLEKAAKTGRLVGIEIVELNPGLDRDNQTAELALSLLESALGKVIA